MNFLIFWSLQTINDIWRRRNWEAVVMSIRCCFESVWQTPSRFLSNKSNPTKVQNLTDFLIFLIDDQFFDLPEKLTLFFLHREIQQIYVALKFFGFQSYPMTSLLYPVDIFWTFIGPDMAMTSMDMTGSWKNLKGIALEIFKDHRF